MSTENILLSSEVVEISESNTYLELTSRICYYDDTNSNGVLLPSNEAEDKAQTLVNMPVQAKYRTNIAGMPTFSGHEMLKDENGNISFGTQSIGTHTEVYIENANVDVRGVIKNLPCLYAKYRIWKRYENVVAAVRRLFSIEKLFGSWEIVISSYEYKDGIKRVTDYEFLANTLLGYEYAKPSYGVDAKALSLSTDTSDGLMVAEALSQDIISQGLDKENEAKEDNDLQKNNATQIASEDNVNETSTESNAIVNDNEKTEISQLTDWDLREKVRKACRDKIDKWCWPSFHFPVEKEVWCEYDGRETELDYLRFTYEVENDEVTVSDPEPVKLVVSPKVVNTTIAELNTKIAEKDDAIIKSGEEIIKLKAEVSNLTPFKEKFEKAEQEKVAAELQEKKDTLVSSVTKSGLITKEEIEKSEELKGYVDTLDDKSLKAVLAERYIDSLNNKETIVSESLHADETKATVASVNLNNLEDEQLDVKSIMKSYLSK